MTKTSEKNTENPALEIQGSRLFTAWLAEQKASLAFTTYQAGKIFMIGLQPNGRLSIYERTFPRPMGIGVGASGALWISGLQHMWRFENFLDDTETKDGVDGYFVPVHTHLTGDIDVHDVHVAADGSPVFVATRFNAIATLDGKHSFVPLALPPFIDRLAAEDRCHLNGLEMQDDQPRFATAVSSSNVAEGWREHRRDGGVVIDLQQGDIIADGLSMPHSPRWYDGKLWLINSGSGELGFITPGPGTFEPVCFLNGFARGFSIFGTYAVVTVSSARENGTFSDLVLGERLDKEKVTPFIGLAIVNLETGDVEHRLTIKGVIKEIYDCAQIPGIINPAFLGLQSDETRFMLHPAPMQQ